MCECSKRSPRCQLLSARACIAYFTAYLTRGPRARIMIRTDRTRGHRSDRDACSSQKRNIDKSDQPFPSRKQPT
ncbi:hypothetical protein DNTS_012039 [Danionella cerebrum]|uniref:Uncharacterized protein n=1 Tax=Danionella cerebrum TaxID=2873325 RepID=A0A553MX62_9TELE|nr:hypothetical protein DNTS_012039 [Danionella translucida]